MTCFSIPRYPGEIKDLLSKIGRTTQQSQLLLDNPNSRITKLIENGWIKELKEDEKQIIIKEIKDKRAKRRRYVQSTLVPLINYIKQQIPLAKNEERQLKHLLEKKSFKSFITWENGFYTLAIAKEFLFQLTLWMYIADKYMEPYRIKNKPVSKIVKKKLFSDITNQIMEKRETIADRIAPNLKIDLSSFKEDQFYPFIEDIRDKLKPPLFNKLMKLSNNQNIFFDMAITFLACGEFMNEFKQKQSMKSKYTKKH